MSDDDCSDVESEGEDIPPVSHKFRQYNEDNLYKKKPKEHEESSQ